MIYYKPTVELIFVNQEETIATGSVDVSVGGNGNNVPLIEDVENAPDLNKGFDFQV